MSDLGSHPHVDEWMSTGRLLDSGGYSTARAADHHVPVDPFLGESVPAPTIAG